MAIGGSRLSCDVKASRCIISLCCTSCPPWGCKAKVRRAPRTTCSHHGYPRYRNLGQGLPIVRPDQVGGAAITYVRLPEAFVYLAVLMDLYTRRIRGWHLNRPLDQTLPVTA